MTSGLLVPSGDGTIVKLRVSPNARSTALQGSYADAALKLRVAAPPVDGKTSAEVGCFVAEATGATPSGVRVVRGFSGRDKTILVDGVSAERAREVFRSRQR